MKIIKKKFVYLISPNKILKSFYRDFVEVLKSNKISFFQLRLKKDNFENKLKIAKRLKKICQKFKVKLLINDDPVLAKRVDADGCHLGQKDMVINDARRLLKKKIIGITCHNSIKLAKIAFKNNADYVAFGAFNSTNTKKVKFKANIEIKPLSDSKLVKIPEVIIFSLINIHEVNGNENHSKTLKGSNPPPKEI